MCIVALSGFRSSIYYRLCIVLIKSDILFTVSSSTHDSIFPANSEIYSDFNISTFLLKWMDGLDYYIRSTNGIDLQKHKEMCCRVFMVVTTSDTKMSRIEFMRD
jgi:hypothetical protein